MIKVVQAFDRTRIAERDVRSATEYGVPHDDMDLGLEPRSFA